MLIAGCGYVGRALAALLVEGGHEVYALSRNPDGLPAGVLGISCDLSAPIPEGTLPARLDGVAYLAAPSRPGPGRPWDLEAAYRAVFVDGPRHLLAALERQGQRPRVVFASSTSVYAQDDGQWVDEDSPTTPDGPRGALVLDGEQVWASADLTTVGVRLGGIYGPERTRLLRQVRDGALARPSGEEAERFTNRIHRDDAAGLIAHLLEHPDPAPLYLGVDDDPAPRGELLEYLAARLGVALPAAEPDAPAPESPAGAPPRRPGSKRCSNARARASGYEFRYPSFREGYDELLRNLGE